MEPVSGAVGELVNPPDCKSGAEALEVQVLLAPPVLSLGSSVG